MEEKTPYQWRPKTCLVSLVCRMQDEKFDFQRHVVSTDIKRTLPLTISSHIHPVVPSTNDGLHPCTLDVANQSRLRKNKRCQQCASSTHISLLSPSDHVQAGHWHQEREVRCMHTAHRLDSMRHYFSLFLLPSCCLISIIIYYIWP